MCNTDDMIAYPTNKYDSDLPTVNDFHALLTTINKISLVSRNKKKKKKKEGKKNENDGKT